MRSLVGRSKYIAHILEAEKYKRRPLVACLLSIQPTIDWNLLYKYVLKLTRSPSDRQVLLIWYNLRVALVLLPEA